MRIVQIVKLVVKSYDISPSEVTTRIGLHSTNATPKASHLRGGQLRPLAHIWEMDSGLLETASIDEHVAALIILVLPVADAIAAIVDDNTRCYLQIVRKFYSGGDNTNLGFGLDENAIRVLTVMKAELDIDEYDYSESQFQAHD